METKIIFPCVYSVELVVRTMWEALGSDISLLAEKCLLSLLLEAGSLPVNVFHGCLIDESLPFSLCKELDMNVQNADGYDGEPKDDGVTPKDDGVTPKGDDIYDEGDDGFEDHNMSGGEGTGEGDQEFEDNSGSYGDEESDDDDDDDTDIEE